MGDECACVRVCVCVFGRARECVCACVRVCVLQACMYVNKTGVSLATPTSSVVIRDL